MMEFRHRVWRRVWTVFGPCLNRVFGTVFGTVFAPCLNRVCTDFEPCFAPCLHRGCTVFEPCLTFHICSSSKSPDIVFSIPRNMKKKNNWLKNGVENSKILNYFSKIIFLWKNGKKYDFYGGVSRRTFQYFLKSARSWQKSSCFLWRFIVFRGKSSDVLMYL